MSRTPEETARLAATVTVETIYGDVGISAEVAMGAASARFRGSDHPRSHALACLAADLAEARAEVAALRQHVELLAEWQAARRALLKAIAARVNADNYDYGPENEAGRRVFNVEARMLAAVLSGEEVGRG